VAPSPSPSPTTAPTSSPQATSRQDAASFLATYSAAPCLIVRPAGPTNDAHALVAAGADHDAFYRFDAAFRAAVGFDPKVTPRLISSAQCPALALVKLGASGSAPRIELANDSIAAGGALAGTVRGLAGRRLVIFMVDETGDAVRLRAPFATVETAAGGDVAKFSAKMGGDPGDSVEKTQLLVAVAADGPMPTLETFKRMPIADLARQVVTEMPQGVAFGLEFFKLTK
jgi:hypothetical protein